jgi:hypothetical protein
MLVIEKLHKLYGLMESNMYLALCSGFGSPRFARRLNCIEFWAKKSVGDFIRGKENFLIKTI